MKIRINKIVLRTLILLCIINIILEYYYTTFVVSAYRYYGFIYDFNIIKYLEAKLWIIAYLLAILILSKKSQFIYGLYIFLGVLIIIPSSILFAYSNTGRLPFYSIILFFAIIFFISQIKFKIKVFALKTNYQYYLLIIFSFILLLPIIKDIGFKINPKVLLLQDIYELRAFFVSRLSTLSSYTFWWLAKSVIPVIIVFSLIRKNKKIAIFAFFILLYLFMISGHKSIYILPVIVLFFYYVGRDIKEKVHVALLFLLFLLIGISILDSIFNTLIFKSLFVRRVFFIPALLTQYYFDFFQGKPLYLSHSIFSSFIEYPYNSNPVHLIAREYFNKPEMAANNGIISDGYMNFGFVGVLLYSTLFSLLLAFFNSINIDQRYFGIFVYFIMVINSSALLTVILTHGLWLVIIFALLIFPVKKNI